jgi:hypothetical protein
MLVVPLAAALLTALPGAATAAGTHVLNLDHGRVTVRSAPALPADPVRPTAADAAAARAAYARPSGGTTARAAAAKLTVASALSGMLSRRAIDREAYDRYRGIYSDAQATLKKLSGRRRDELQAVLGNLTSLAASGKLTSRRAPLAFMTVQRNREWWANGRLLAYGERVTFGDSKIQWQSYPGQGIQVQWLGTFGTANGMTGGKPLTPEKAAETQLKKLLDEITPLAVPRAGGIAWEYMFRFGGGSPPWVSGLAQGTALQVYTRAAYRLADDAYMRVAKSALGIFEKSRPTGIRQKTAAGSHFLIYSYTSMHVLNGFIQALNGLHDYAVASGAPKAQALFAEGEAEARVEVPQFDTGAWSLYQPGQESDLGYHTLLRDFLKGLCTRLTQDRADAPKNGQDPAALPSPDLYCTTEQHFTTYLTQAPKVSVKALSGAKVGSSTGVRVTLSKISTVTMIVRRSGAVAQQRTLTLGRGTHTVTWGPIVRAGGVDVTVTAKDLAGNAATATTTQAVAPKR